MASASTGITTSAQESTNGASAATADQTTNTSSSTPLSTPPTLLDALSSSLCDFPGSHSYMVQVLRSQPRRSHALFPHATNHKNIKVWQEEVIVLLSEKMPVDATSALDAPFQPSSSTSEQSEFIPILGLEANIYTIPSTSTSMVYISKVDTTGLSPSGFQPTRSIVSSFVEYSLRFPPHHMTRVRVHVFAKAHGQYLFPGSKENDKKKVLDDKGLIRWWKATLSSALIKLDQEQEDLRRQVRRWYLVPGMTRLESLPYVPDLPPSKWTYDHPYSTLTSPLCPASSTPSSTLLPDHIPCFPDDPKARFQQSLTSSTIASAGNEGDYDDVILSLSSASFASGQTPATRAEAVERDRQRERTRLIEGVPGGVNEWWERMAFRQECCSGVLVGFFVLAKGEPEAIELEVNLGEQEKGVMKPMKRNDLAVPHSSFTRLWSQFHNVDYALTSIDKLVGPARKWKEDVERITTSEESDAARASEKYHKNVMRYVNVSNAEKQLNKRPAESEVEGTKPVVNMLAPRKKVKKVITQPVQGKTLL